jgi:flavin reductase (DIM6/NTAB) family NADH-FMN oxidoreductase RutF
MWSLSNAMWNRTDRKRAAARIEFGAYFSVRRSTGKERTVAFEERQFRDALGAFPTGVAVVTGLNEKAERVGVTVSSFNSVSISPPLVLFSIARHAHS